MSSSPALPLPAETGWTRFSNFWSDFRQSPVAVAALIVVVAIVLMAVLAPFVAPQDPYNQETLDLFDARLEPGEVGSGGYVHWLGTDAAGRDIFSAILYGLRTSLIVGVMASTLALVLGTTVGLVAAYYGGRIEALIMRIIDLQLSLPAILLALVLVAMLGQGLLQLV
ncbi:MAG: ABC transporter permease, partial [Microvirga sp.]